MTTIRCPSCNASRTHKRALEESSFPWICGTCHQAFEVRVVFLPRQREIDRHDFCIQVEELLTRQRLSRSDLARLVGVSPAYISTILSGRRAISVELATRILCALQLAGAATEPKGP